MSLNLNPLTLCDGYKLDHRRQYPDKTQYVYSNWTPRSSRVDGVTEVTFLGLQYFLMHYLQEEFGRFFADQSGKIIQDYTTRFNKYLGPNNIGDQHIIDLHKLGYLPLEFRAIPEGMSVPLRVPMLTVENTDPRFYWLTNYIETLMSCVLWMPCTSATLARQLCNELKYWAQATGGAVQEVDFQAHDFSFRGMPGLEAACLSGMGHLVHFKGSDTFPAIEFIEKFYPSTNLVQPFIAGTVPATEHSVMCAGGEEDELATYNRLLDLYPSGIVSIVSDTWDFWKVLTEVLPTLKNKILARAGTLVIRPDSGDPVDILCGDPNAPLGSPERKGAVEVLWDLFGGTMSSTGHRILDSHIRLIYGDSITFARAQQICQRLAIKRFATCNVVLGVGSYSYQYVTRDTYGFAMKATHATIDGQGMNMFKSPKTDTGLKFSAKGRLSVLPTQDGSLQLISRASPEQEKHSMLQPVWKDGKFIRFWGFDEVRNNAKNETIYEQAIARPVLNLV